MRTAFLAHQEDFEGWRDAARSLALSRVPPSEIHWQVGDAPHDLFADEAVLASDDGPAFSVPRPFIELARSVVCHSDPERFALLYTLLLRLRAHPGAMEDAADPLLQRLESMAKAVCRDIHKMRAFLRFREVEGADEAGGTRYVAWFEPEHHIVRANAGFFVRRFASMRWSILTPELSLHWDGETLKEGPGATRADAPSGDQVEEVWKTYYASIFNPARVKVGAMLKEMPKKYWKNMPETALVGQLIAGAQAREAEMVERSRAKMAEGGLAEAVAAEKRLQPGGNALAAWEALVAEARSCTRCDLYKCGTQTVFGEGPLDARLLFVGEQPGDQEDLAGRPFVGPAGGVFDKALADAGVDRAATYVTNAVKHFKFERRGKRRIHSKPDGPEITACRWWLEQELALIRPPITVALGATAARSLFGKAVTISATRGKPHALEAGETWVTVHPSFLLRVRDNREEEYARFVEDLHAIGERAKALA
ncbi:UdgX family uracil-DNA binding protein [Sphingosinicella humi]|uniref:Type-4 uracil-DNA glycosylase n=1 Tax=Allosphingosinicella humi TaxID=2068657 RepID=A0A2U2J3R6_9SPHN|nr:UdgX family uracil-DNA binding protein [Sphingosinicella humi]PWG02978.1 uracil-DNA glycosylase [Sphingosinicella humi]